MRFIKNFDEFVLDENSSISYFIEKNKDRFTNTYNALSKARMFLVKTLGIIGTLIITGHIVIGITMLIIKYRNKRNKNWINDINVKMSESLNELGINEVRISESLRKIVNKDPGLSDSILTVIERDSLIKIQLENLDHESIRDTNKLNNLTNQLEQKFSKKQLSHIEWMDQMVKDLFR